MNVAELQTAIRDRGYEADTAETQLGLLNSIQRRVAGKRRWEWTLTDTNVTLVAGAVEYVLPADLSRIVAVELTSGSVLVSVDTSSMRSITRLYGSRTGTPTHWAKLSSNTIRVWPQPAGGSDALVLSYHRQAPLLVENDDVPIMPPEYHDILVVGACEIMAQRERQFDAAQVFGAERRERTMEMEGADGIKERQTPSRVVSSGFYERSGVM